MSQCLWCYTLKKYLNRKNIEFQAIDVLQDPNNLEKMIAVSGQRGVPVIDINGQIIIGFDKEKIDQLLKI